MKAKELRIGSLINYNGIICKVEAITNEYVSISGYEENRFTPIKIEDIKDEPITEEWLLDFGFEKRKVDFPSFQLNGIQINCINGKWQDYASQRGLPHIHQLQNLYFALTGEELTTTKDFTDK